MRDTNQVPPPKKRRWLPRYGMRAVFVLVALAAVVAWWVRNEVLPEQRREELFAIYSKELNEFNWIPKIKNPTWKQRMVSLVRGKPVPPKVTHVIIRRIGDPKQFSEFCELFPIDDFSVEVNPEDMNLEVFDALTKCRSLKEVRFIKPVELSNEMLARLGRIRVTEGVDLNIKQVDDQLLKQAADAGVVCRNIADDGGYLHVTDEGLRSAATFQKLVHLTANRNATDEGFAAFRGHKGLNGVHLIGPGYTDKSADVLATIPNLASIALIDAPLTDAGLAKAIAGRKLGTLKLHNVDIGEKTIEAIGSLPWVERIDLKGVRLSRQLVAALLKHPTGRLAIDGEGDDELVAGLAPLAPNLISISLAIPSATDVGLAWLADVPRLNELHLRDTRITGKTLRASPSSPMLSLGGPNINKEALAATKAGAPVLLSLFGDTVDDEGLSVLPGSITRLVLTGTRVTVDGLKNFPPGQPRVDVYVQYAEGTDPPYSDKEIEEIQTATQGRVKVTLHTLPEKNYQELLPKSLRKPLSTETNSP
jgi:hypothetical protein